MEKLQQKRLINMILAVLILGILVTVVMVSTRKAETKQEEPQTQYLTQAKDEAVTGDKEKSAEDTAFTYESRIFDTSYVHTVDILITDWDAFLESAPEEVYFNASLVIDGERFDNVAIRSKGNSSRKVATKAENGRYSFKIEFDHYVDGQTYYGLDKLHLNNLSYDSTCVKDYIAYYLMAQMDVPTSFCSYVFVTVNGEDHGLYIALEGIEDSYLERNFGEDFGNYLKPDDKHNQVVTADTTTAADTQNTQSETEQTSTETTVSSEITTASSDETTTFPTDNSWLKEGQVELATLTYVDDNIDSYVVLFNSAKSEMSTKDKEKLIKSIKKLNEQKDLDEAIDVDEIINYMTVQNFMVNYDGYIGSRVHNYYLYVDNDGKMSMLPWDYNMSFGTYGRGLTTSGVVNCPLDNPYGTELGSRPMFDWIVESYSYREEYHKRTLYLVNNYIENGKLEEEIDRIYGLIEPYMQKDPTKWVTMDEFNAGINELKQIIALRGQSLKLQVQGEIPSTVAGQTASPDKLLDVGELDVAKTGT